MHLTICHNRQMSLLPEQPMLVYPALAQRVGVEEALLLGFLDAQIANDPYAREELNWHELSCASVLKQLPFWTALDLQRLTFSLRDQGCLSCASAPFGEEEKFRYRINHDGLRALSQRKPSRDQYNVPKASSEGIFQRALQRQGAQSTRDALPYSGSSERSGHSDQGFHDREQMGEHLGARQNVGARQQAGVHRLPGKRQIDSRWQPIPDTYQQLSMAQVPRHYAESLIPEFITYWRSQGTTHSSWDAKFMQHVMHRWRKFEVEQRKRAKETVMERDWRPSDDALIILIQQGGISPGFIEDAIPEFVLYWQEKGDLCSTWNSRFITHINLQWKRFRSGMAHSTDPKRIDPQWRPSQEACDVLKLAHIPAGFAATLIPEFVLYWKDSNQLRTSWDTTFLQYAKKKWAERHVINAQAKSTRETELYDELNDRSWAS